MNSNLSALCCLVQGLTIFAAAHVRTWKCGENSVQNINVNSILEKHVCLCCGWATEFCSEIVPCLYYIELALTAVFTGFLVATVLRYADECMCTQDTLRRAQMT